MPIKIRSLFASVLLMACCLLVACKADPKEIISRKWKPVDARGSAISENLKDDITKEGNMMEFTTKGVFTSYTSGETPQTGSYKLNEGATQVTIQTGMGSETSMNIKELTMHKLVLETNGIIIVLHPVK